MNNSAIVLLSGGLDSLASIAAVREEIDVKKALHFNYGQNPLEKEKLACEKICKHYNIELETIDLPWLAEISKNSALSSQTECKESDRGICFWIPNRNGLFVNIGACYAESLGCKYVIIGANLEEAEGFKDNSSEFIKNSTSLFKTSTQNNVELIAPLINMSKKEIIKKAIELNAPIELVWSCYYNGEKHCGKCPSCKLLNSALIENKKTDLQNILF